MVSLVNEQQWAKLWEGDELLRELKAGRLLSGFQVGLSFKIEWPGGGLSGVMLSYEIFYDMCNA